jgi:hypothetical protein
MKVSGPNSVVSEFGHKYLYVLWLENHNKLGL